MEVPYLTQENINAFITSALEEDIGDGDHSSLGAIPAHARSSAQLLIKDEGILAGMELAGYIFKHVDEELKLECHQKDGDEIAVGDVGMTVTGNARSILAAERLVLNCMQRMSGIATYTHLMSALIKGTRARLLDTRKTTPNFRMAEKWAVRIGGGVNHRFGLYDMVMLKDNHIDYAGGVKNAILQVGGYLREHNLALKVEIEVRSLDELREVLDVVRVQRV